MRPTAFHLLRDPTFRPLFLTQFLGAFNDNLFKNAMVILILFRLAEQADLPGAILVTAAAGLFILPFFLFSAFAGRLADASEKARLVRGIKLAEVVIMSVGAVGLIIGEISILMFTLFAMGAQSALFGPVKYGVLPQILPPDQLVAGNALVNAATFLAILLGTIIGGLLVALPQGPAFAAVAVVAAALLGWTASLRLPSLPAADQALRVGWAWHRHLGELLEELRTKKEIAAPVFAISWFWFVGATYLAQFPAFARDALGGTEIVVTLFLTMFTVGIGVGAMICAWIMKRGLTTAYAPFACLAIAIFSADLYWISTQAVVVFEPIGVVAFVSSETGLRVLGSLFGLSVAGGLYIVPFYALLQMRAAPGRRARVIAALNVVNALFMVLSSLAAMAVLALGFGVADIFVVLAVGSVAVAVWILFFGGFKRVDQA